MTVPRLTWAVLPQMMSNSRDRSSYVNLCITYRHEA